ncbi:MAG: hypothetical protein ACLPKT_06960, partial [Methylocella sp.]
TVRDTNATQGVISLGPFDSTLAYVPPEVLRTRSSKASGQQQCSGKSNKAGPSRKIANAFTTYWR